MAKLSEQRKRAARKAMGKASTSSKTVNVPAPEGHHWMKYAGGPVLMKGADAGHKGASKSFPFEIVKEHDPDRMAKGESKEKA
mgnify:CR=1 FL=1